MTHYGRELVIVVQAHGLDKVILALQEKQHRLGWESKIANHFYMRYVGARFISAQQWRRIALWNTTIASNIRKNADDLDDYFALIRDLKNLDE
jgi:hypothetical protein